jgi:hypothetical protein
MKPTTSPLQIFLGVLLGIVLLPAALLLAGHFWTDIMHILHQESIWPGLEFIVAAVLFSGIIQAFTILPAALVFLAAGKYGVVSGLLYFGTFLALLNVLAWIARYRDFFLGPIY